MNAIERLTRDHAILRSKFTVLEGALAMGPEAWYVLREMAFTLAKQLRDHIRREERLVDACRQQLKAQALEHLQVEHRDEPEHLRTLTRLFIDEPQQDLSRIAPVLLRTIQGLRAHMAEEERDIFPVIARVLAKREPGHPAPAAPALDETMTVNRLLQEYPAIRPVLDRCFISVPLDGCYGLDEVAWRHGMDTGELMKQLEEALHA